MATGSENNTKYAVVEVEVLRAISQKSADQILASQSKIDDEMLSALEEMISVARSNKLDGNNALALRAMAW